MLATEKLGSITGRGTRGADDLGAVDRARGDGGGDLVVGVAAFNLTLGNAASGSYTLIVLTVVAAIFVPIVIAAQCWAYWTFRRRIGREEVEEQVAELIELPRPVEPPLDERRDASAGR